MKNCIVIGGGIIGLCSAYYLAKAGHQVTVLDKSDLSDGCSYGNAGMIVPSHFIPLAQPGMIGKGIRWMFNSKSPFYVQPRLSADLLQWGMTFYQHANAQHVEASKQALLDLSLMSKDLYKDLTAAQPDIFYQEKGLLMLYQSEKVGEEEIEVGEMAKTLGVDVDFLDQQGVQQLEAGVQLNALGGVHFKSDAHLYPNALMSFLKQEVEKIGVEIIRDTFVESIEKTNGKITGLKTANQTYTADEFVLCAGSWSPFLAKQLGIKIQLLPGKGYSFNIQDQENNLPTIPSILCEGKVAVSPFQNSVRFGGTMEITQVKNTGINLNRVEGIVNTVNSFYPEINLETPDSKAVWSGFRPCTPTGMPIISRNNKYSNLTICTGHGMMGISLGPASGKLVEEIISEQKTTVDINRFTE